MDETGRISFETDLTPITITGSKLHIKGLEFSKNVSTNANKLLEEAKSQIIAYLSGGLKSFDLPLAPEGTEFQKKVWTALLDVAYGQTVSYRELSLHLGDSKAVRAVASANGSNPLPLFYPCHRIIGSKGALTGYIGGLQLKRHLLELESGHKQLTLF